ncbi:unnamed protein product, partial [Brassica rapa subsp. narinosa]
RWRRRFFSRVTMDLRGWDPGDQRVTRDNQRVDLHHYEGSWRGLKQTGVSTRRDRVNFGGNLRINGNIWRARSLESVKALGSLRLRKSSSNIIQRRDLCSTIVVLIKTKSQDLGVLLLKGCQKDTPQSFITRRWKVWFVKLQVYWIIWLVRIIEWIQNIWLLISLMGINLGCRVFDLHHSSVLISIIVKGYCGFLFSLVSMTQSQLIGSAMSVERNPKRLKISGPHFDNTGLIDEVQFDFEEEEDIDEVLKMQLFHIDYWMLSLVRWQSRKEQPYPSEIIFWVKVLGFPLEFWAAPTFERIGEALGEWLEVDLDHGRIKVKVDGYKRLCFETSVDFRGGEFHDREEALISLRYEKRRLITSLCRISVTSLLFVGSLVLVSFYPKFMNWNKDGLVGFYI